MLCFEVDRNGQKLCTAGVGDFGVLTAILTWVSHEPEKLERWAKAGIPATALTSVELTVGGLGRCVAEVGEHYKWVEKNLAVGDEIRIRIRVVEVASADPPSERYEDDPEFVKEQRKKYVRKSAKELGWAIETRPADDQRAGSS